MYKCIILSLVMFILHGCVAVQTFPTVARAGDTTSLAIGSLEGANKNNLTIYFESDTNPGVQVDITASIRSVFKLYPDKTSNANLALQSFSGHSTLTMWSAHELWQTVVALDLPSDLAVGTGNITVISGAGVVGVNNAKKVDDVLIDIEILPEINGAPATFEYFDNNTNPSQPGNLAELEPRQQILVRVPKRSGIYQNTVTYGYAAAEYLIRVPMVQAYVPETPVPDEAISVINHENYFDYGQSTNYDGSTVGTASQKQMFWKKEGENVRVSFVSPKGLLSPDLIRFSIVPSNPGLFNFSGTGLCEILSITYYDENGDVASTSMTHEISEINF